MDLIRSFCRKTKKVTEQPSETQPQIVYAPEFERKADHRTSGQFWNLKNINKEELHDYLSQTEYNSPRYVNLCLNNHSLILTEISEHRWLLLKSLYLRQNNIVSLQKVSLIDAPQMTTLDLAYNRITIIKSLRKSIFLLKVLILVGNPILSWNGLSQISFEKECSTHALSLFVQSCRNYDNNHRFFTLIDYGHFARAQSQHILRNLLIDWRKLNMIRSGKIVDGLFMKVIPK